MGEWNVGKVKKIFEWSHFKVFAALLLMISSAALSGPLDVPNEFEAGTQTSAADMNANFSAVETAVNDNDVRISAMETASDPIFQGYSNQVLFGNAGVTQMVEACDGRFSGSKICNTTEFANSVAKPCDDAAITCPSETMTGRAWILPVMMPSQGGVIELNTGVEFNSGDELTCEGWSSQTGFGMTATEAGQLEGRISCGSQLKVACCL
jgi:hypothetical protein